MAEASANLLIGQWRNAEKMRAVVEIFLSVINDEINKPIERLALMAKVETAEGVWLDYIGVRLGVERPWVRYNSAEAEEFGFDDAGVGYDQERMRDLERLEPRTPLSDLWFRRHLRARGRAVFYFGTAAGTQTALSEVDGNALVNDGNDMSFTIKVGALRSQVELGFAAGTIPRPAGVRLGYTGLGRFGFDDAGESFNQGAFN